MITILVITIIVDAGETVEYGATFGRRVEVALRLCEFVGRLRVKLRLASASGGPDGGRGPRADPHLLYCFYRQY